VHFLTNIGHGQTLPRKIKRKHRRRQILEDLAASQPGHSMSTHDLHSQSIISVLTASMFLRSGSMTNAAKWELAYRQCRVCNHFFAPIRKLPC